MFIFFVGGAPIVRTQRQVAKMLEAQERAENGDFEDLAPADSTGSAGSAGTAADNGAAGGDAKVKFFRAG